MIDPHGNLAMREEFAPAGWPVRAKKRRRMRWKNSPSADVRCRNGQRRDSGCLYRGNLSSTANVLRAGLRIIGLQQAVKRSPPFS